MEGEWRDVNIEWVANSGKGSIAIGPFGSRMKSDCYVDMGVPVIRGTNITGGKKFKGNLVYITENMANSLGSCNVGKGDLVFPHRGAIGEVGIINHDQRYVLSSSLMKLTCDESKADVNFIYYFFKSHHGKYELLKNASQVGTPGIGQPLTSLKSITLKLPPLEIQKAIAQILSTLDDKIELNRQTNQTLEAMAQALFKSWYVDFDPVIDNALAAGSDIPEPLEARAAVRQALGDSRRPLPEEIRREFPDGFEFVDEMGWVPRGWECRELPEVVDFLEGPGIRNWQYTDSEDGIKFINIRCIQDFDLSLKTASRITREEAFGKYNHFQLEVDDIVISTSGTLGRYAFVRESHLPLSLNTSVIRLRPILGVSTLHYLSGYVSTKLQIELETRASGSVQRNFGPMHLKQILMMLPNFSVLKAHDKLAESGFRKKQLNLYERESLETMRDTLLPKLLSGQLTIPDAEKLVANAI